MIYLVKKYWWIIVIMIVFFFFLEVNKVGAITKYDCYIYDNTHIVVITLPYYEGSEYNPSGYRIYYQGLPPIGTPRQSAWCSDPDGWEGCYYEHLPLDFNWDNPSWWLGSGYYYIVWYTTIGGEETNIAYHKVYSLDSTHWILAEQGIIWASLPVSGTEILTPSTLFTFNWEGIDPYDLMIVGFNNRLTGLSSDYLTYEVDDLIGSSTTINLDTFNIDKNGDWYFQGFLSVLSAEVYDDLYFTGRYSTTTTEDLAYEDNYYLTFSVLGFETLFQMETFEDWYSINSTRYDSPTNMFIAIAGFFEPTFNKIGEFGERIRDFFDVNEAYNTGFEIGKNIPVFGYYLSQINIFIGNFPFIKWVFIILLFFIGVFIFRLVLKFIPTLG